MTVLLFFHSDVTILDYFPDTVAGAYASEIYWNAIFTLRDNASNVALWIHTPACACVLVCVCVCLRVCLCVRVYMLLLILNQT